MSSFIRSLSFNKKTENFIGHIEWKISKKMETYFNINYEFDKQQIFQSIDSRLSQNIPDYICVADGVILNIANRKPDYLKIINESMFSICDSSYVPLYLKWIYGIKREQYCGSEIFMDIVKMKKYRMFFMGTSEETLQGLKIQLSQIDPRINDMSFYELPFRDVEDFNYSEISEMIKNDHADIIWVALGAPKQEVFMNKLKPHLNRGVMIAVGAVFKFFSGVDAKRAPQWMVNLHTEFIYRIFREPGKQIMRCLWIIYTLPKLFLDERNKKK